MRWKCLILPMILLILPTSAEPVEYRLQVVSVYEEAFAAYTDPGSASAPSLSRLEAALDRQEIPKGTILYDRPVQAANGTLAKTFLATPVRAETMADRDPSLPEFRWEGMPGTRTVWVVETRTFHVHEVIQLGLKGTGPFRHVRPYGAAVKVERTPAVGFPANLIDFWNGRPSLWDTWLSRYLDLSDGIAAVVAVEPNAARPDRVYLVIEQPAEPRTFKVVLAWRKRLGAHENLFEAGGDVGVGTR